MRQRQHGCHGSGLPSSAMRTLVHDWIESPQRFFYPQIGNTTTAPSGVKATTKELFPSRDHLRRCVNKSLPTSQRRTPRMPNPSAKETEERAELRLLKFSICPVSSRNKPDTRDARCHTLRAAIELLPPSP